MAVAGTAALAQQKAPPRVSRPRKKGRERKCRRDPVERACPGARPVQRGKVLRQANEGPHEAWAELKSAAHAANLTPPPEQPDAKQKALLSKLRTAHGPAFDQAYLAAQLKGHKQAIPLLRKYAKSGRTAQLKEVAQKTLPIEKQHLSEATELTNRAVAAGQSAQSWQQGNWPTGREGTNARQEASDKTGSLTLWRQAPFRAAVRRNGSARSPWCQPRGQPTLEKGLEVKPGRASS